MDQLTGYVDSTSNAHDEDHGLTAQTLICFSHLRWDFVFQRPQHLMSRFARTMRVLFWEEPIFDPSLAAPALREARCAETGVTVLTPVLPTTGNPGCEHAHLRELLTAYLAGAQRPLIRWYYTPMMLPFSEHVPAACVAYDCMDELANFKGAPPELLGLETRLMEQADIVFTGGYSLYEAKRDRHPNIHPFPSSVDKDHFALAREAGDDPFDQRNLATPRFGFHGVVDERMDLGLLAALADARPEWAIVIVGPVVKISEADLPRRPNLHFLGGKRYGELPEYLRGWDVALMPFAINEATRFISPTKTPEYLAAGRPVVSTAVRDVVRHYGDMAAVLIAESPEAFILACDRALALAHGPRDWMRPVEAMLAQESWDNSFARIAGLIAGVVASAAKIRPVEAAAIWPLERPKHYDVMVVGAGFAGSVMAERLANDAGKRVLVVDRRPHVAGNAYDRLDDAGILIHQYGPHIFHTNSAEIFGYLSRFTAWRRYEHRVLADLGDRQVPMPINRKTLNLLYDLELETDAQAAAFLAERAEPVDVIRTSADVVISAVGRELYETFFQGYTRKQWGMDPSQLDKSVTSRVPTRTNLDDRYFTDTFQAMPEQGFTRMFERMLDHPNIDVLLGTEYRDARAAYPHDHLVFTGPIDEYFDHRYGKLPYRSLRFRHETVEQARYQDVAVVNYPDEAVPYTRVTEYKHLTGQQCERSSITFEYPAEQGDPYYPIPRDENQLLFKRYEALAMAERDVTFVGRLATYRYYNMDQVVGQALTAYRRLAKLRDAAPGTARNEAAAPQSERMSAAIGHRTQKKAASA